MRVIACFGRVCVGVRLVLVVFLMPKADGSPTKGEARWLRSRAAWLVRMSELFGVEDEGEADELAARWDGEHEDAVRRFEAGDGDGGPSS